jgi:hypothetical protein
MQEAAQRNWERPLVGAWTREPRQLVLLDERSAEVARAQQEQAERSGDGVGARVSGGLQPTPSTIPAKIILTRF